MSVVVRTFQAVSRAVPRKVQPGSTAVPCWHCPEVIGFRGHNRPTHQVICNIYADGRWTHVEHYHLECYRQVGSPYGPAQERGEDHGQPRRVHAAS
ncbi:MAG TPA: hypothetical protein VK963_04105 [Candidatus Saccharimonadales bacterium]|nr:hypothetical protein [Candidatus Saccharimonadales bacterium]